MSRTTCQTTDLSDIPPSVMETSDGGSHESSGPSTTPTAPTTAAGSRFTIIRKHAEGGLGRVYLAHDKQLRRTVALKEIRAERANEPLVRRRFLAEAEITGGLEHPGIVPIYALEHDAQGRPVYAMRFIQGRTLADMIQAQHQDLTSLGLREMLQRFIAVCQTMAYAHNLGVIHRDLKPDNVMIGDYGETLIVDWGLAKEVGGREASIEGVPSSLPVIVEPEALGLMDTIAVSPALDDATDDDALRTTDGSVLGTPAYMAPEQARGEIETLGPAADIYALGGMLYEILTGRPPYTGRGAMDVLRQVLEGPPRAAESTPPALRAVCERAMARETSHRYLTAAELARDVERWLADEPVIAYREPLLDRARRWARRRPSLVAAMSVSAILLILGGSSFTWWQQRHAAAAAIREREERQRLARNGDAVAAMLDQCSTALGADDTEKASLALDAAEKRAADGGAEGQADRLVRSQKALALLRDLDAIDDARWDPFKSDRPSMEEVVGRWKSAFESFGIKPGLTRVEDDARCLTESSVRDRMLLTLDLWLLHTRSPAVRAVLRMVDADAGRNTYRDALMATDWPRVASIAGTTEMLAQKPRFLAAVGQNPNLPPIRRREVLQAALRARQGDLALLMALGETYSINEREGAQERVRWYQAAVAAHPNRAAAHHGLGCALKDCGDLEGAVAALKEAIRCDPVNRQTHYNLGTLLFQKGDLDGAIQSWRESSVVDPKWAKGHSNLGYFLFKYKKDYEGGTASLREALRLDPNFSQAHAGMGLLLASQGEFDRAIGSFREALRCDPDYTLVHKNLGDLLEKRGDLAGAAFCYKEILRLWPKDPYYPGKLAQVERQRELLPRLADVIAGRSEPKSSTEAHDFAVLCAQPFQKQYAAATRLYAFAFEADPKLANDLAGVHRYNAATTAVSGGCGLGRDAPEPATRAALRARALEWLRADLALREKQASSANATEHQSAADALGIWLTDVNLAGIRPGAEQVEMPDDERANWDAFWAEVRKVHDMAKRPTNR